MLAFGVLLLILPQLGYTQCRRKREVPFSVYYTFRWAPYSSSVFWRIQGLPVKAREWSILLKPSENKKLLINGRKRLSLRFYLRRHNINYITAFNKKTYVVIDFKNIHPIYCFFPPSPPPTP